MRRLMGSGLLALVGIVVLGTAAPARALMIAPPPTGQRLGTADAVLVGRVDGLEDTDVEAAAFPGSPQKMKYRVAIVLVNDPIMGVKKDQKKVRIGFIPPPEVQPGGPIRPGIGRFRTPELKPGQEGLFLVAKHFEKDFFVLQGPFDLVAKADNASFAKEVEQAKKSAKLIEDPMPGLKAKSEEERLFTAALLIARYRNQRPGFAKTEPISAQESKLILAALAEADWTKGRNFQQPNPYALFSQLGLTDKDGWKQPQFVQGQNFMQVMSDVGKAWIRDHGANYRIQRFVAGTPSTKQ